MVTLNEELSALEAESRQFKDTPSHLKCLRSEASFLQQNSLDEVEGSDSDGDVDFQPDDESDTDNEDSEEAWRATCVFSTVKLADIHACLSETVIPSWIERPPTNLKSHGKLKADQWFLLFSILFWGPLIRLSEFPYERQNGNLQKIKTNGHICELYFII
jgi:hypothetical protein